MVDIIIDKLCLLISDNIALVPENTEKVGVASEDLIRLKFQGILVENNGTYNFRNAGYVYSYGRKLLTEGRFERALRTFKKCLEINPNHVGANYCLFYECIKNRDYSNAIKHLIILFEHSDEKYKTDYNFYFFLLSNITKLPEDYDLYVRYLRFEDVKKDIYDESKAEEIEFINEMRRLAMNRRFNDAFKIFLDNRGIGRKANIECNLINDTVTIQNNLMSRLKERLFNKDYSAVIQTLEEIKSIRRLGKGEKYTLSLSKTLLRIRKFGFVPESKVTLTQNIFEAIDGENYSLALTLAKKSNIKDNFFEIILNDIIKEINNNKRNNFNAKLINEKQYDLLRSIHNHNKEEFLIKLNEFLGFINKSFYYPLFEILAEIEMIDHDSVFDVIADIIINMNRVGFVMDTGIYLHNFYLALHESKFELAGLYLSAIRVLSELNKMDVDIEALETIYNRYCNKSIENSADIQGDNFALLCKRINEDTMPSHDTSAYQKEAKYISKQLSKQVAVILPETEERFKDELLYEVSKRLNIKSFTIDNHCTVIMRQNENGFDSTNLLRRAYDEYDNGNYDEAIKYLSFIIESCSSITKYLAKYYNFLASIYYKKKDLKLAYNYSLIADGIFHLLHIPNDDLELLQELEQLLDIDSKSEPIVLESEFVFELDPEILDLTETARLLFSNIDSIEADCQKHGLSEEETLIVYLILARDCYHNYNYKLGDELLEKASYSQNSKIKYLIGVLQEEKIKESKVRPKSLIF